MVIKPPKWTITNSESISPEGDNVEHRFWCLHSSHCRSSILIVLLRLSPSQGTCCARKHPSIARSNQWFQLPDTTAMPSIRLARDNFLVHLMALSYTVILINNERHLTRLLGENVHTFSHR